MSAELGLRPGTGKHSLAIAISGTEQLPSPGRVTMHGSCRRCGAAAHQQHRLLPEETETAQVILKLLEEQHAGKIVMC